MQNPPPVQTPDPGNPVPDKGIDWEALPSLSYLIGRIKSRTLAHGPVWSDTQPVDTESAAPSDPFSEPLPGMSIREVTEPDIFKFFFNAAGVRR